VCDCNVDGLNGLWVDKFNNCIQLQSRNLATLSRILEIIGWAL
jgi:hypothetical protein